MARSFARIFQQKEITTASSTVHVFHFQCMQSLDYLVFIFDSHHSDASLSPNNPKILDKSQPKSRKTLGSLAICALFHSKTHETDISRCYL